MSKQITWGYPTWVLFHSIAEKVNNDFFLKNKDKILNYIISICNLLPCPICQDHATKYLKQTRFKYVIRTKEQLKRYLFDFHNVVNIRTKRKKEDIKILEKYKTVNFYKSFMYFYTEYRKNYALQRYFHDQMGRKRVTEEMYKWLNANNKHFNG